MSGHPAAVRDRLSRLIAAATRGLLAGISETGEALIDFPANALGQPLAAGTLVPVTSADVGRDVLLMFEDGDPMRPIIIGFLNPHALTQIRDNVEVTADGKRTTITAAEEIVLKCGEASITLTKAGKVLIRGAYVSSRSSGANRIKGGSVQIN